MPFGRDLPRLLLAGRFLRTLWRKNSQKACSNLETMPRMTPIQNDVRRLAAKSIQHGSRQHCPNSSSNFLRTNPTSYTILLLAPIRLAQSQKNLGAAGWPVKTWKITLKQANSGLNNASRS